MSAFARKFDEFEQLKKEKLFHEKLLPDILKRKNDAVFPFEKWIY